MKTYNEQYHDELRRDGAYVRFREHWSGGILIELGRLMPLTNGSTERVLFRWWEDVREAAL